MEEKNSLTKSRRHQSKSSRCDLIFPVGKIHRFYKQGKYSSTLGIGASVYTAAVLEYITHEVIELAGRAAAEKASKMPVEDQLRRKVKITPKHVQLAIREDSDLNRLMALSTITVGAKLSSNI